jgi:hypothetical protein
MIYEMQPRITGRKMKQGSHKHQNQNQPTRGRHLAEMGRSMLRPYEGNGLRG